MEIHQAVGDAIVAAAADAVVATDPGGLILLWNPGAERIFGHKAAEAIGCSLDLIVPERLRAAHWGGWQRVMATGESRYGEGDVLSVPSLHKDGRRISVEFTIIPLKDNDGRITGMVAVMRDVTARFEQLKALRKQVGEGAGAGRQGAETPGGKQA